MKHQNVHGFTAYVAQRNTRQPEYLQAVTEVRESLWPHLEKHPNTRLIAEAPGRA